jgi:hypothetical protein
MTPQERWYNLVNQKSIIKNYMAMHDEEVKTRKLKKFLGISEFTENKKLEEAVVQLHDIARLVEQEIGQGSLSKGLRDYADKISIIAKGK